MKKTNLLLKLSGAFVLFGFLGYFSYTHFNPKAEYTPEELWQMEFQKKKDRKKHGIAKYDKPDQFTKYYKDITTPIGSDKGGYRMNYRVEELQKAQVQFSKSKRLKTGLPWIERGPANVGGRTRALIVDPDDATGETWFVGAATGGIWKTTNSGLAWTNLSDQFTNLSVNALAMAESNRNVIYAGTGESFPGGTYLYGNGIWKSTDKGATWIQLTSTATDEDFAYVNRIVVDPANENIVLAATESGIFKSTNGGTSWSEVYSSAQGVEDLVADPTNFNVLLAGEHTVGVLRSSNAGNSWVKSNEGLGAGTRFELSVSPVDHNFVYVSVNVSNTASNIYQSQDNGLTWKRFNDSQAFLNSQGDYDNTIAAHPYIADEVFVGGVDVWKAKFNGTTVESAPQVKNAYTVDTDFLGFINFGGAFLGGGMSIDDGTNRVASDWVSVEIRFAPGLTQKAHRFKVPDGATSGVAPASYVYQDYVDVPFQVWDVTNNRQLMVSFRDQENDNVYNLYERIGENYGQLGREYIFVNAIAYDAANPNSNIILTGGHLYKCLYMFWPTLNPGSTWTPNNLPVSKIVVDYGTFPLYNGVKTSIADSYGNFGGPNRYNQSVGFGTTAIPGLHPDHHNIKFIPKGNGNFYMIDANDGGLAISKDNGATFNMLVNSYITTQFYGVAKNPQANEYIGGMQDNGTWQSPSGVEASLSTNYLFRIGGDGFECLWHAKNPNLMLGSVYNNSIRKSTNKGLSWTSSSSGILSEDGPFITRLSASKDNPDLVFAVGKNGVYRSTNFGTSWSNRAISTNWKIGDVVSSSHNVEVSLANGNIVWAGAGMAESGLKMHVSTNEGMNFTAVQNYSLVSMNAYTSGIATHPTEDSTAFVLFSLQGKPKVLRTKDLGQTWEDLSGFGTGSVSTNGFPDVVVNCLVVMPHDPNTIWVGTDIGLFESNDNGTSWHIANNGLPPVSVYEMKIVGKQVVVATHGRGIWTVDIPEIDNSPFISEFKSAGGWDLRITTDLKVNYDSVRVYLNGTYSKSIITPTSGVNLIDLTVSSGGTYTTYIKAYINEVEYKSNTIDLSFTPTGIESYTGNEGIGVFPNPSNGNFTLTFENVSKEVYVQIFSLNGMMVYFNKFAGANQIPVSLKQFASGTYIVKINTGKLFVERKLVIK